MGADAGNRKKISEIKNTELIDKIEETQAKTNTGLIDEIGKIQEITNIKLENNGTWQQQK